MSIVVTPGETALITEFANQQVPIKTENLLIGDIHIVNEDNTPIYIIERKAKGDLEASIMDGRYREQKSRLQETGISPQNVIYVLEQLSKPRNKHGHKILWSAICNTQHRDKFRVFHTKNVAETVEYIKGMAASVNKFPDTPDSTEGSNETVEEKKPVINVNIKKKSVQKADYFKYTLTLISGCSLNIAEAIINEYSSLDDLREEINNNGPECLADIRHGESKRRIGKPLSKKICDMVIDY